MMQCGDCCDVQYTRLSSIHFSDFTPSRITRPSSNHFLQEHCAIDELYDTVRHSDSPSQLHCFLAQAVEAERKLKGKYIQVEFAKSYPGSAGLACSYKVGERESGSSATTDGAGSDWTANGTVYPLCMRSRTERRRIAIRRRDTKAVSAGDSGFSSVSEESGSLPDDAREMDIEPSVVMYHDPLGGTNAAMLGCNNPRRQHFPQDFAPSHVHARRRVGRRLVRPVPFQLPADDEVGCEGPSRIPRDHSPPLHTPASAPSTEERMSELQNSWHSSYDDDGAPIVSSHQENYGEESIEECCYDELPALPEAQPIVVSPGRHRVLSRQIVSTSEQSPLSPPTSTSPTPISNSNCRVRKPLPPPKAKSQSDMYANEKFVSAVTDPAAKSSKSSPDLSGSKPQEHRLRSVSFMNCSAGAELGRFPADYLGCKQVDGYIGYADSVAKCLINSRPIEVMVYVTSEKLRLAPPKNSSVLFKSFAMKDILSVQKCSKNKRIVSVAVWKSKSAPMCHMLRCPTTLVSNALHESILDQTQSVDDISPDVDKISPPRPLSTISSDSCGSGVDGDSPPPPSTTGTSPQSPSEFLHKIPAIHIGSAKAGRHDSVNDVIQRVLLESRPTAAKEISVWLSLAQLRLVDMSDEREMIYEAHETSRIRAIGVYAVDKRFIGYIVKEEEKPLMGHVLRCNSAALMVSLASFLRQACQIMFSQQGGSLYDELSTDESDTESSESPTPGHGLIQRLRCITNAHKPLSPTVSHPTFISHTPPHQPLSHTHAQLASESAFTTENSTKKAPLSPLEFPEEHFARFSVTYIGSAVVELPFSLASLSKALALFQEGGVAAGRAAVVKNIIQMHISALGINLIDKKHRLFVNRNYPRKQLVGYCRHPEDDRVFAFSSRRPGYPHEIKCHVFRQVQESAEHILEVVHHWLELDSTPTQTL